MKEKKLVNLLIQKKLTISTAESCTGGMLVSKIVNVSNASKVLNESFVTYSNESKTKYLGVNPSTIQKYGVVSEEVAGQMADGVCKQTGAAVGVGISGIAGPTGATKNKPVGMVCFGFCVNKKTYTFTKYFHGSRFHNRHSSTKFAINKLISLIK